ncbi:MAG: TetR/AcrR family transcriptional regulator [Betaproteobacteria bacterium]|nr:TetR/AcrR family transcriptional regulator [Betaproteobacteria bacterium]
MQAQHESKTRILDAAMLVFRTKGYAATTVDDVCASAQLTKGSFFHHFKSKQALAVSTAQHFADMADGLFSTAPYRALPDPLARLLAYVEFRRAILQGKLPEFTCLLGTMVQETYDTHPAIRKACDRHIGEHAAMLADDIAQAKRLYAPRAKWTPDSLALYMQATIQGAFILAKARRGPEVADECLSHLHRYLELLFQQKHTKE